MSLLTLPPVSNRSLISGAGSSNRGQRIESNRPNQTSSPRLVGLPGTQTGQKGKSPRRKRSNDDLQFDEEKLRAQQFWVAWGRQMAADMLKASMEQDSGATRELLFTGRCGDPPRFRRLSGGESVATDLSLLTCSTGAAQPSVRSSQQRRQPLSKSGSTSITTRTTSSGVGVYAKKARTPRRLAARRIFRDDDDVTSEERFMLRMCAKTRGTHGVKKASSTYDVRQVGRQRTEGAEVGRQIRRSESARLGVVRDAEVSESESVTNSHDNEKRRSRSQLNRKTTMLRFRKSSSQASEAAFSRRVGHRIRATVFALELMTGYGDSTNVVVDVDGDVGLYTGADYSRIARYPQNIRVAPQLSRVIRANIRDRMGKRRVRPITVADIRSLDGSCAQVGRYQRNLMIFNWLQDVDAADFTALPEPPIVELEAVPPRVRDYPPRSPTQYGGLSHISSTTAASESNHDFDSEDEENHEDGIDRDYLATGSQGDGFLFDENASMPSEH